MLLSLYFSRFLPNHPRPLSSFDTHARWQPVTQSAQSRWSYGKIEDCEQSSLKIDPPNPNPTPHLGGSSPNGPTFLHIHVYLTLWFAYLGQLGQGNTIRACACAGANQIAQEYRLLPADTRQQVTFVKSLVVENICMQETESLGLLSGVRSIKRTFEFSYTGSYFFTSL